MFIYISIQVTICEHEIRNINCACQDSDDLSHFAYITKDADQNTHYCHVFNVASMVSISLCHGKCQKTSILHSKFEIFSLFSLAGFSHRNYFNIGPSVRSGLSNCTEKIHADHTDSKSCD